MALARGPGLLVGDLLGFVSQCPEVLAAGFGHERVGRSEAPPVVADGDTSEPELGLLAAVRARTSIGLAERGQHLVLSAAGSTPEYVDRHPLSPVWKNPVGK